MQLLAILDVLPFDDAAAIAYGKICACLQKRGTPIGTMDILIAGHAKEDLVLVSNSVWEFARVPVNAGFHSPLIPEKILR